MQDVQLLTAILCFAGGHVFRDGWPGTGSTQTARIVGALICGIGAAVATTPHVAVVVALGVLLGFYLDQKHAEGQQARDWVDAGFLALSGISSLAPLALLLSISHSPLDIALMFVGAVKPAIWFGAWRLFSDAVPTRVAAGVFGAVVGAAVVITLR